MLQEAENAIPLDGRLRGRMSNTNGAAWQATKKTNVTCSSPFSSDTSGEQVEELHKLNLQKLILNFILFRSKVYLELFIPSVHNTRINVSVSTT